MLLALSLGGSAAASAPGPELLPDLRGLQAQNLYVQQGSGYRDLRVSTTVANAGAGVLEIYPVGGTNCDGDGDPSNDRAAFQRVYRDGDGNGFFTRLADTDSTGYEAGCMIYHPAHAHWHFEDFARYDLRRIGSGEIVSSTTKVSFCVIDSNPFDPALGGFDPNRFYTDCGADATEGLSIGWSDTYVFSLPGQTIDIRGVPDGDYCLAVAADPSDIVRESDESNNEAATRITLAGNTATPSPAGCTDTTALITGSSRSTVDSLPMTGKRCKKPRKRKCRRRS